MAVEALAFHAGDPKLHRVLSAEAARCKALSTRVAALEERAVQLVTALLSSHPESRVGRPALAARLLVETLDALTHRWILEPSGEPVPVSQLAEELTGMLTAYVIA